MIIQGVFKKWKNLKCILNVFFLFYLEVYHFAEGIFFFKKKKKILADKLDKFPSKKEIINFYWDRDMARQSIKAKPI